MLPDTIQSTVFRIDLVEIATGDDVTRFPVHNATHRLRVREVATAMTTGCLTGRNGGLCQLQPPQEEELTYEVMPEGGPVTLVGQTLHFASGGLRIWTKAIDLAERVDACSLVSNLVLQPIISEIEALNDIVGGFISSQEDQEAPVDPGWLREQVLDRPLGRDITMALANCVGNLFGDLEGFQIRKAISVVDSPRTRVFDFHAHARFHDDGQGTRAEALAIAVGGIKDVTAPDAAEMGAIPANLVRAGRMQPIIWFPFQDHEAFAFGATTGAGTLRLFGRLGPATDGYRISGDTHWKVNDDETRILTFREDIDPRTLTSDDKHAEFDAGAIFPGDVDTKLSLDTPRLYLEPVPFYIGAMPLEDPKDLMVTPGEAERPHLTNGGEAVGAFAFLSGELDVPIVFDPIQECNGCCC